MTDPTLRATFPAWPSVNARLRDGIAALTAEQLAIKTSAEGWPLWAVVGHLACQRVFWLCDFAGEQGAETTPFPNAGWNCPGDDDLEHVFAPAELAAALESTFRIVESCLDRWTPQMLEEVISHPEWGDDRHHARGWILSRVYAHDVYHVADLNGALGAAGLPQVDIW
jgi:uncharacterized damage-inducible protein DinB